MKKAVIILAGLAFSAAALAQLSKHKDWAKSPEAYFLTAGERQEWSRIQNDADAEKFIASYWAKRDPNPATANNEFRDEVNRRIAAADEQFKMRRQRGAESARGRLLVVLGSPSRFSQQRAQEADQTPSGVTAPTLGTGLNAEQQVTVTWTYDKNKFDPSWDIGEVRARILVDPQGGFDSLQSAGAVDRAIAKIAEKTVVNPGGQIGSAAVPAAAPPAPAAATGAAPPPAAAAPVRPSAPSSPAVPPAGTGTPSTAAPAAPAPGGAAVSAALPAAAKSVLETMLQAKKVDDSAFWGGTFRSIAGEPFYAFQLYIPAEKESASAAGVKLGGLVQNASGQQVATFWEDATLSEMKTGTRTDRVYEKSLVLPAGEYRGSFALFPAAGGDPITSSAAQWTVAAPTGFDVSPLILGNTLTPLTRRPAPTDPFVFGSEKPIKVEPKANKQFTREDGLWYFYTVSNPTIAETAPAAPPAATPVPSTPSGASPAPPGAAAAPAALPPQTAKPRIQTRISVMRDGKAAFAPFTGPAEMQPLGSGYYASGSEIPLATFEPGRYTFGILVRDLNAPKDSAANKGIERKEDFIVLLPDGKLPEMAKAAPAAPAGAKPKPTPRKP